MAIDEESPPANRPTRWRRYLYLAVCVAVLVAVCAALVRRVETVEVVAPGAMVVRAEPSDFGSAYYSTLLANGWTIVRESGRSFPAAPNSRAMRLGRTERTFRSPDGMEVTVDTLHDGEARHIVLLSLQPAAGKSPPRQ